MPHRSFLELALRGDRPGVRAFVATLRKAGYTPERLALEVLQPALVEVGERWMRNELSVADEHLVSAIAERVLAEAAATLDDPEPEAPLVLLASVASEAHRIGQQILEGLFLDAGFRVHALGSQVPAKDLLETARRLHPQIIGLSVTMSYHVEEARHAAKLLRSALPPFTLLVGGAIFKEFPDLSAGLEADWIGHDGPDAVRFARSRAAAPTPPAH